MANLPKRLSLIELQVNLLSALANGTRLTVLKLLVKQELSVGALARAVGLSQSALSQHLAKLRNLRIVQTRRDSQHIYYSCQSASVVIMLDALDVAVPAPAPLKLVS